LYHILLSVFRASSVVNNDKFHADVHGGNLLVLPDGRVGFIDFGIVGQVSERVWNAIGQLVQSFVTEDYKGVAESLVQMGATDNSVNIDKFGRELEEVVRKIRDIQPEVFVETTQGFDGTAPSVNAVIAVDERETTEIVLQIVGVAESNGLKLPREFGLLLKQSLYFDRYQKLLAPELDPLRDPRVREAAASQPFQPRVIVDTTAKEI
jgi:aarF domain-containing kinase